MKYIIQNSEFSDTSLHNEVTTMIQIVAEATARRAYEQEQREGEHQADGS